MPTLTRWFIKTSFVYLALALIVGLLLAMQSIFNLTSLGGLFPIYIHLLVFGWLTQLVFGVVYWMFPKYSADMPRGSEPLGWWTYALLNIGLILRAIAEPVQAVQPGLIAGWTLVVSAGMQFLSGLTFVLNSWKRVRVK
jgi:cbb3-type cytochrome oxidase subunit 1